MAPIVNSVEVAKPSAVTFDYAIDPSQFHKWQSGLVAGRMDRDAVTAGAKCITTRRIGGRAREITSEITAFDPPRHWADHGLDGPIRGIVQVDVEALDDDTRSRVTISLDFEGHGIGKLLIPLMVRRQAEREMPANMRRLKEQLESL
ncbi:MAG TPA: SRPBCC family protein [Mycobacteriales bacterium]